MEWTWIIAFVGLGIGITLQICLRYYLNWYSRQQAQSQAKDIIETAEEQSEELLDAAKEAAAEYNRQLQAEHEVEFAQKELKILTLKEKVEGLQQDLNRKKEDLKRKFNRHESTVKNFANIVDAIEAKYRLLCEDLKKKKSQYSEKLVEKLSADKDQLLSELSRKLENQARTKANDELEQFLEELQENSEREAKRLINISLNRFIRPYCPERGIGFITLENDREVEKMLGPNKIHIELIEELCGVDIIYNDRAKTLSVSGFDPVRRELARATLEKLLHQKYINREIIEQVMEKCKRHLFKQIKTDGDRVAKELRLNNLSPEICNMMGALNYRYSFTQNQYYHCAEVGHLCGMLSSELNLEPEKGRRAGLLHDIGKAMDHSLDGGHAVIGADFIEKHGEENDIVHAVRAHHFDEMPSTDLAYLVIAADAISGARPGARRSTTATYVQKMDQLQEIGNSFPGVIDTFILSAGREVRIKVDSAKIDDATALQLSREIAKKIEIECNYPGTIKVTVVRESQAVEMAR